MDKNIEKFKYVDTHYICMYIEKRKEGNKIKYYLAHSFREGNKFHKIRKFIGFKKDEERINIAKKLIEDEINQYRIINDPLNISLSEKEIRLVQDLEKREELSIFHLSELQWGAFSELFTYNTNAIEGSELNFEEVKNIFENNKWPEKSKNDIAEAYGVNEAIQFIRKTKEHLSLDLIKNIHKIIFKNSKSYAGKLRKSGEEVVIRDNLGNILHQGAPQSRIISLLKELVKWYNKNKEKYPALVLAAVVHNQFENIHPFRDGNGRIGRLLLNNILIKHGFPPVNINFKNRFEYYQSLQEYGKAHNLKPTIDLIIKEYKEIKRKLE